LFTWNALAQGYSIDWYKIAGGGGNIGQAGRQRVMR